MDYKQVLQIEQKLGLFTTWTNWEKNYLHLVQYVLCFQ